MYQKKHSGLETLSIKEQRWLRALSDVVGALTNTGIEFFLDSGTLLGAVRDGAFIPWDNDIDLGTVNCHCDDNRLIAALQNLCSDNRFTANICINGACLMSESGVEINIKFYELHDDCAYADYSYWKHESRVKVFLHNSSLNYHTATIGGGFICKIKQLILMISPVLRPIIRLLISHQLAKVDLHSKVKKTHLIPLSTMSFYGNEYPSPAKKIEYLVERYGENWNRPVKNYDYTRDDLSMVRGLGED